jgi:signal transduction histidine kinase
MSMWRERAWSIGRIVTALAVLAGTQLLLRGNPGYWVFVGGTLFVVAYGTVLLLALSPRRLFAVFAIGFAIDNLIMLGAWWSYLHLNRGGLESNDLWLVIVPVAMFGIVRVGWLAGGMLAVFWLAWLSWSATAYFPSDSYDVTQLPLRLMFIGVAFLLVLRLVAMVSRERRLERVRMDELAQLERFKSSLVRSISHELRTPLTSAKVYTELLDEISPDRADERARAMRGLRAAIERLERIVEQSTDFALMAGSRTSAAAPVDLQFLAVKAVDLIRPEVERRGQQIVIERNGSAPVPPALGDAIQVERVFLILLDNAVRYSPEGGSVSVRVVREVSMVRVDVCDEGPGIPDDVRRFMFTTFYRGSDADRLGTRGVGLGLALAKELIERQGGDIGLAPREGGGTIAYFRLPVAPGGGLVTETRPSAG